MAVMADFELNVVVILQFELFILVCFFSEWKGTNKDSLMQKKGGALNIKYKE